MKREIIVLLIAFVTTISSVCGQEKITDYTSTYFEKKFDINASQDKKDTTKFTYYIDCASADKLHSRVNLMLESSDLTDFIDFLNKIKATYTKWQETAKQNNVTELEKEIDIKPFKCQSAFIYGKWNFDFAVKLTPRVKIIKNEMVLIVRSDELESSSNQFMKHDGFYLIFSSAKEIDEFINEIAVEKLKEHFRKKNKSEDLFKN